MNGTPLSVERRQGYRVLTLDRPERLNSFNEAMHAALATAIDDAGGDLDCRTLVLTGAGRAFCAGQDLAERVVGDGEEAPDLGETLDHLYNPLVRKLRALPIPVIAAVNGVAAGAGANLALACDIVLAARSATFIQAFSNIGLLPDCGGTWLLPRLVGPARARALAMLAEPVSAEQAADWGMIWRVVEDADLMAEAHALAGRLALRASTGLALIKQALERSAENGLDAQLDLERDLQRTAGRTADYQEGVRAFIEKRPARFAGRSR